MRNAVGQLDVYTFKAGVLAAAAHDLQLRLPAFEASLDGEAVAADLPLADLRLVGPVEHGVTQTGRYRPDEIAAVESAMRELLRVAEQPVARFRGRAQARDDGWDVSGALALAGKSASLALAVRRSGQDLHAGAELQPSRWGIREYKALMGAIRLQDRVRIAITLRER